VLWKYLGSKEVGEGPEVSVVQVQSGDRFLLCTDGLHGYIESDREVGDLIGDGALEAGAQAAVALANQRGGRDNITALVIEIVR